MQKVRLYWEFYKSTVVMNLGCSVLLAFSIFVGMQMAMLTPPSFIVVYIRCCMFGGPVLCLYNKVLARKNEFYFYHNKGIARSGLFIATFVIYISLGVLILNILHYAKLT
jgi:hypothetical protein